jgi:aromatic-L-amino-acid/L-tryptophan decarboxylase
MSQYQASLIDDAPNMECMAPVELSMMCFRYILDSLHGNDKLLDTLNRRIMEEALASKKACLNVTIFPGCFLLLFCTLHYDLAEEDVVGIIE